MDHAELVDYVGRDDDEELIVPQPLHGLDAALDLPARQWADGDPVPPAWQWLFFLPRTRASLLENDGHARRGPSLPPAQSARRLFAGGRMLFHRSLRVGSTVRRTSSVAGLREKTGASGKLVFLTVRYEYLDAEGVAIEEEQDIVFRAGSGGTAGTGPQLPKPPCSWSRTVTPDAALLFRFSALTFNAHRIHYDSEYARTEGYPGLIVHGPLLAILLLDLASRHSPHRHVHAFNFRARTPAYVDSPVTLCGDPAPDGDTAALAAIDAGNSELMRATVEFSAAGAGAALPSR